MRILPLLVPALALAIAGCSSSGKVNEPQAMATDLRGKAYPAMWAYYRVEAGNVTGYTSLRDASTTNHITTATDGTQMQINAGSTVDNGGQVAVNQTLTLPPSGVEFRGPLHWPSPNASLSHMAYGAWELPATATTPLMGGFFAFGNLTPGAAIPTTGTATYNGQWTGVQWVQGGQNVVSGTDVRGTITGAANFAATSNQILLTALFSTGLQAFSGSLSYVPGTNELSGTMTGPGVTPYSGTAFARFFGPAAEELGGSFRLLQPAGVSAQNTLMGSFGARK